MGEFIPGTGAFEKRKIFVRSVWLWTSEVWKSCYEEKSAADEKAPRHLRRADCFVVSYKKAFFLNPFCVLICFPNADIQLCFGFFPPWLTGLHDIVKAALQCIFNTSDSSLAF